MDLDDAYANGAHIPGAEAYPPRWAKAAESFRAALGARAQTRVPYGEGSREWFDLFLPEGDELGVLIFVHGGYWRAFEASSWSHLAEGAIRRGWAVAMPNYTLCPEARISQITQQIACATEAIAEHVPGSIAMTGHSAGGHLVARMLAPGMVSDTTLARVSHVVPISPLADLRPLRGTVMNNDFKMSEAEAIAESPVLQPRPETPVTVWVGAEERPAFLDQARWLATAWDASCVIVPQRHHFDVIDSLSDSESSIIETLLS